MAKMKIFPMLLLSILFLFYANENIYSQEYSLTHQTIALGGGTVITPDSSYKAVFTIGQPLADQKNINDGGNFYTNFGIWSFFLKEPDAPIVTASRGQFPNKIEVDWEISPLSPPPNAGFKLYRDADQIPLATLPYDSNSYSDIRKYGGHPYPGKDYMYILEPINNFASGNRDSTIGFISPTGIISGIVKTQFGNPVKDVEIRLTPNYGKSVKLNGTDSYLQAANNNAFNKKSDFSFEAWVKFETINISEPQFIVQKGSEFALFLSGSQLKLIGLNGALLTSEAFRPSTQTWYHFALAHNPDSTFIMVDSNVVAKSAAWRPGIKNSDNLLIGKSDEGGFLNASIDDIRYWNVGISINQILRNRTRTLKGNEAGLAAYWKLDEGRGAIGYDLTSNINNINLNSITWNQTLNHSPVFISVISDSIGYFKFDQLWFDSENSTDYTLNPFKLYHNAWSYEPSRIVTLSSNQSTVSGITIIDESMISISGFITWNGYECPVDDFKIVYQFDDDTTRYYWPPHGNMNLQKNGFFRIEIEPGKSGTFYPQLKDHTFNPGYYEFNDLATPLINRNFSDLKTNNLTINLTGGCESPIGKFQVVISGVNRDCGLTDTITTNSSGKYPYLLGEIYSLPPVNYNLSFLSLTDPANIVIENGAVSLKDGNKNYAREWRAPIQLRITGLEDYEKIDSQGDTIIALEQIKSYNITIEAFEKYDFPGVGDYECTDIDGYLNITDIISGLPEQQPIPLVKGKAVYTINPKYPNFYGDFQNSLEVIFTEAGTGRNSQTQLYALTEGVGVATADIEVVIPELPFKILHDPPGDGSYSFIEESTTLATTLSISTRKDTTTRDWDNWRLGGTWSVGASGDIFDISGDFETYREDIDDSTYVKWSEDREDITIYRTTGTEYKTSENDEIVGESGDLFIGSSVVFMRGAAKNLVWNDSTNTADTTYAEVGALKEVGSTFFYTENHIRNVEIPNALVNDSLQVAQNWLNILKNNMKNRFFAVDSRELIDSIIFSAGPGITYYEENTKETTNSYAFGRDTTDTDGDEWHWLTPLGGYLGGEEATYIVNVGTSYDTTNTSTTRTGFYLYDDDETSEINDISDRFVVNVYKDPQFGTPLFDVVGGESSCPWEVNTTPREGVLLTANRYSQTNVLPNTNAVFLLNLTNTSLTNEDRRYRLTVLHETNPYGALVKINGIPLEDFIEVDITDINPINLTMEIERGPIEYIYDDITLRFYSECNEMDDFMIWDETDSSWVPSEAHLFYQDVSFDVEFEKPCSQITLNTPANNWVINQHNDSLSVVFTEYNLSDENLNDLVLQYFPIEGSSPNAEKISGNKKILQNNTPKKQEILTNRVLKYKLPETVMNNPDDGWFTAYEIPKDSLTSSNYQFSLDIAELGLSDGKYKLRAKTECAILSGYSNEMVGTIDRVPPDRLGIPQPADGVLDFGDEITMSFTEEIAPLTPVKWQNRISVIDTKTQFPVPFSVQVTEDKLYINLEINNAIIENDYLFVTVTGVEDMYGNVLTGEESFGFTVYRNPIKWETQSVTYTKYPSTSPEIQVHLVNRTTIAADFEIINLPPWMTAFPYQGDVSAASSQLITFTLDEYMNYGEYETTITARNRVNGDEELTFNLRILAEPPAWTVNPAQFQYTMNVIGELLISDSVSTDSYDMVSAFVGRECRAAAHVEEVAISDSIKKYLVMITIYSKVQQGEIVEFRVWDALEGIEYARTIETLQFQFNRVHGGISQPFQFHATNDIFQRRDVSAGWSWVSYNVEHDTTLAGYLSPYMNLADGDQVKWTYQSGGYIQYNPASGWAPESPAINLTAAYLFYLYNPNTLETYGTRAQPGNYPVQLSRNWNWIGYLPQMNMNVNNALVNFDFSNDDFIKSQTDFAVYIENVGWVGTLTHMSPSQGYMLKVENGGQFIYPNEPPPGKPSAKTSRKNSQIALSDSTLLDSLGWVVNPHEFQYNMTVTAQIKLEDTTSSPWNYILAAFINNEFRGYAQASDVMSEPYFFVMLYDSIYNGETITFKYLDLKNRWIRNFEESLVFNADDIIGTIGKPFVFSDLILSVWDEGYIPKQYSLSQNYPNPFNPSTKIEYGLPEEAGIQLIIYNILGEKITEIINSRQKAGYYLTEWNGRNENGNRVPSGVYFYRMTAKGSKKEFVKVCKLLLLK